MTPTEALDILIAVYVEYGHPPSQKDLWRLRELLPDSMPYVHPLSPPVLMLEEEPE